MFNRIAKIATALGVMAALGFSLATTEASAGTTKCWRGTGGYYCY